MIVKNVLSKILLQLLLLLGITTAVANAFNAGIGIHLRNIAFISSSRSSLHAMGGISESTSSNSEELLSLLLQKANPESSTTKLDIKRIEYLMESLQNQNISFDPKTCLNGPLFAALHQTGPQPFWEKFDLELPFGNGKKNIKGQRYTLNEDGTYNVFNYAEFLGDNLSAQGVGDCRKNKDESSDEYPDPNIRGENDEVQGNIFTNLFKNTNAKINSDSSKVNCPADYTIQVTGASLNLFKNRIDFDIQGTGYLRVLYADENLRIFTTPKNTDSTLDIIDEVAGLTVVQVRVDLVDPTFSQP